MRITESELRKLIRKELLRSQKYKQVNEIAVSGPVAGAAAVGATAVIFKLKKIFRNKALRELTFDFIKKSPQMLGSQSDSSLNSHISSLTLEDIENWTKQDGRLSSKVLKGPRKVNVLSTLIGADSIKAFNTSKARKIFIENTDFKFDNQDIKFFIKIYSLVRRKYNNDKNKKFQIIDTLFRTMIMLYNKKYSDEAKSSKLAAEKEFSQILSPLGIEIKLNEKNSWESQEDYDQSIEISSKVGISSPGRAGVFLPNNIAKNLTVDQLVDIAKVHVKYANNLPARLYVPYQYQELINLANIESDIRSLKNKFEFFTTVTGVCIEFMSGGSSKTLKLFFKELSKSVAGDQGMEIIIDKLIKKIENSSLKEGTLKEVIKFIINVMLSSVF